MNASILQAAAPEPAARVCAARMRTGGAPAPAPKTRRAKALRRRPSAITRRRGAPIERPAAAPPMPG